MVSVSDIQNQQCIAMFLQVVEESATMCGVTLVW